VSAKTRLLALGLAGALSIVPLYEGTRLKKYRDPIGIWTDCTGHTGRDVRALNTLAQCDEKLSSDLLIAHAIVVKCTTVPLNPNELSAMVSFAFNVGPGRKGVKDGYCTLKNGNTPSFLRKLNAGDYSGGCYGITAWVNAAGRPLRGLVLRREAEYNLCMKEPDADTN
jgi:lysozyme